MLGAVPGGVPPVPSQCLQGCFAIHLLEGLAEIAEVVATSWLFLYTRRMPGFGVASPPPSVLRVSQPRFLPSDFSLQPSAFSLSTFPFSPGRDENDGHTVTTT
jgi:hypothetical protein